MRALPVVLDAELCGGRWDGHRERVNATAPPPPLRMVLRAELPVTEAGEYWPTTSVYRLDEPGARWRYRYSHDEWGRPRGRRGCAQPRPM